MPTQNASNNAEIPDSLINAKGDIIVGTADDTPGILPIGASNDVLTVSGGTAVWKASAAGGALDDLTDVDASSPDDGDLLGYIDGDGEWEAVKAGPAHASADGATPQIANLVFGSGDPPDASSVPEGTIWIKHSA